MVILLQEVVLHHFDGFHLPFHGLVRKPVVVDLEVFSAVFEVGQTVFARLGVQELVQQAETRT